MPFLEGMLFCYWNPFERHKPLARIPLCNLPYYVLLCIRVNYMFHFIRLIREALYESQEISREATRDDLGSSGSGSGGAADATTAQTNAIHYKRMLNRTSASNKNGGCDDDDDDDDNDDDDDGDGDGEIRNNSVLDHLLHFDTSAGEHYKFDTPEKYGFYAVMQRLKAYLRCHIRLMACIE